MITNRLAAEGSLAAAPSTVFQAALLGAVVLWDIRIFVATILYVGVVCANSHIKALVASFFGMDQAKRPTFLPALRGRCHSYPPPAFTDHAEAAGARTMTDLARSGGGIGMPSGHSQAVMYAAAFVTTLLALEHTKEVSTVSKTHAVGAGLVLCTAALLVGWSRVAFACHTWAQVWVGFAVGGGVGVAMAFALRDWFLEDPPPSK